MCLVTTFVVCEIYCLWSNRPTEAVAKIRVIDSQSRNASGGITATTVSVEAVRVCQAFCTGDRVLEQTLKTLPTEALGQFELMPHDGWVATLRQSLMISTVPSSNLIIIRHRGTDSGGSVEIVRSLVAACAQLVPEVSYEVPGDELVPLLQQHEENQRQLLATERELERLRTSTKVLLDGPDETTNTVFGRVSELRDTLDVAERQTSRAQERVRSVSQAVQSSRDLLPLTLEVLESVRDLETLESLGIDKAAARELLAMEWQVSKMPSSAVNDANPSDQKMVNDLQMRKQMVAKGLRDANDRQLAQRLLEFVRRRWVQASRNEEALRESLSRQTTIAKELNERLTQIQTAELERNRLRSLGEFLAAQSPGLGAATSDSGVRRRRGLAIVVEQEPSLVAIPFGNRFLQILPIGLLAGGLMGLLIAMGNTVFRSFRLRQVVMDQSASDIGLPASTDVNTAVSTDGSSLISADAGGLAGLGAALLATVHQQSLGANHAGGWLQQINQTDPAVTEAFRKLRLRISEAIQTTSRLVVTSADVTNGTPFVLTNLAVAFARARRRTLLIDADFTKSEITRFLDLEGPEGLARVLGEQRPIGVCASENIYALQIDGLDFMPAGTLANKSTDLLAGDRLRDFLAWAETEYNQILIAAPSGRNGHQLQRDDTWRNVIRRGSACLMVIPGDGDGRHNLARTQAAVTALGVAVVGAVRVQPEAAAHVRSAA